MIDMQRLWNWLNRFGLTARGFSVDRETDTGKVVVHREHGFHASGHASGQDLLEIIRGISPEIVVPVHTENPGWFAGRVGEASLLIPEEGRAIAIR